jgi:hypothetical protein
MTTRFGRLSLLMATSLLQLSTMPFDAKLYWLNTVPHLCPLRTILTLPSK